MEEEKKFRVKQTEYANKMIESKTLLSNLCRAIQSASKESESAVVVTATNSAANDVGEPQTKRIKTEKYPSSSSSSDNGNINGNDSNNKQPQKTQRDIYNILDTSFSRGKDVVHLPGAILARITIGGLMNGMAGQIGGIVLPNTAKPVDGSNVNDTTAIPISIPITGTTTGNGNNDNKNTITVEQLRTKAIGLSHVITARLEMDMMQSTPKRIIEMLCPNTTLSELALIRRRIYDTVVLGRGTNASEKAAALERGDDLPVAARVAMHEIDKVSTTTSIEGKW